MYQPIQLNLFDTPDTAPEEDAKRQQLRSSLPIGDAHMRYIDKKLKAMVERPGQDVRMQNVLRERMKHGATALTLIDLYLTDTRDAYCKFCGIANWGSTCHALKEFTEQFIACCISWLSLSQETLSRLPVLESYPFLNDEQAEFVASYESEYGHRPIFFLMTHKLLTSGERNYVIFRQRYGFVKGQLVPISSLAEQYGLTNTAITLICERAGEKLLETLRVTADDKAAYQSLLDQPVLSQFTPGFMETMRREKLDMLPVTFASLIHTLTDTMFVLEKEGKSPDGDLHHEKKIVVLVQRSLDRAVDLKAYRTELKRRLSLANNEDYVFDLRDLCVELTGERGKKAKLLADKPLPEPLREQVAMFLDYCVHFYYGITPDERHCFLWKRNHLSPKLEVEKILRDFGRVMTLQEILDEFTRRFPGSKYCNAEKLRSHIIVNDKIGSTSHRSQYGLREWDGVFFGSIRDRLIDILSHSSEPMHINDIMREVLQTFPDTSAAAIKSSMWLDDRKRFTFFQHDYFGLTGHEYTVNNETYERHQYSFSERVEQLRQFIDEHHRLPDPKGDKHEQTLKRWMWHVNVNRRKMPPEQLATYDELMTSYRSRNYPDDMFS